MPQERVQGGIVHFSIPHPGLGMANIYSSTKRAAQHAADEGGNWIERGARVGYAAKGVVYVIIGVLALQVAIGSGGETTDSRGAIYEIAEAPFGKVLLVLIAVGLFGYAVWRLVEAAVDPEYQNDGAKGVVKRIGIAISGLTYGFLAYTAAAIAFGWGSQGSGGANGGGGNSTQQEWTAQLMAQPFGQWLVGLVGVIIIGVGLYQFKKAYTASFMDRYRVGAMSATEKTWAERVGRFGLAARGVIFCMIGAFLIQAAIQAQPSETRGLSGALDTLARQPYGPWLLGIVAAGLVAFGAYCFVSARYRKIEVH